MFGLFKKKKAADLETSIEMAYKDILTKLIDKKEITNIATALYEGPMPYSTEDLAFSVALNFYKRPENKKLLEETQLMARMKMLECFQQGKMNVLLVQAFEEVLYKLYK
jgi:hypothetical protein